MRLLPPRGIASRLQRTRLFGWWYVCLGLGFALLAVRSLLRGDPLWSIGLRCGIAVGFFVLGFATLRSSPRANSPGPKS